MESPIHSPRELVDKLGGVTKAAETLGERHPSTISNWLKAGRFPAGKFMRHAGLLVAVGVHADAAIWFSRTPAEAAE